MQLIAQLDKIGFKGIIFGITPGEKTLFMANVPDNVIIWLAEELKNNVNSKLYSEPEPLIKN